MAGGRKVRKKNGKYVESPAINEAHGTKAVYCSDKRLVPRIKEYVQKAGGALSLEDMAASLQSTYPEYSRRKRQAFQSLVVQLYRSLNLSNQFSEQEEWLERREQQHFERRMKDANEHVNHLEVSPVTSSEEEDDEEGMEDMEGMEGLLDTFDPEISNAMNQQLLQVYKTSTPTGSQEITTLEGLEGARALCEGSRESPFSAPPGPVPPVDECKSAGGEMAAIVLPQNNQEVSTSMHNADSLATATARLHWQSISERPGTPAVKLQEATPTHADATPTVLHSILKKVTFSTPEVTKQHQFEAEGEEEEGGRGGRGRKIKKLKKRHRHHLCSRDRTEKGEGEEVMSAVKRRKTKEEAKEETGGTVQRKESQFSVQTSPVRFSDVGGCDATIKEICKLLLHLRHPEVFTWLGVAPPQGFLLHGPPGCGKTLLAHAIAGELNLPFIKLAATEVVSGVSGESEGTIRDLFSLAKTHAPCILFVDEIDAICRKRETAQREMERRIVTQLLSSMDELKHSAASSRVVVIGATSSPDSLDPGLRRAGRFDREISLGIPDQPARESILKVLGRGLRLETNFSFSSVSRETPGFVGADLMALVREASLCAVNRALGCCGPCGLAVECGDKVGVVSSGRGSGVGSTEEIGGKGVEEVARGGDGKGLNVQVSEEVVGGKEEGVGVVGGGRGSLVSSGWLDQYSVVSEEELSKISITSLDFKEALKVVQPSAKREGFATVPNVTWDDVGALEAVREELSYAILAPVRYPAQFASLGLTSPPGVLLSGPPGCGKTLLAKAIANESGINFISVKGPELLNMYVGESERAVRQVFQRARNSAPCVIFFDELDALCPKRSNLAEGNASSRVVNQLLTEMDGLVARKQVFIMGATNRPDIIDPAVLRPGRLDKMLYVGLPTAQDRAAILRTITKCGSKPQLGADVNLEVLATDEHCGGYSGADLTAVVREAAIASLRDHMQLQPMGVSGAARAGESPLPEPGDVEGCVVQMKHFLAAIVKIKPSVSEKDRMYYEQMSKKCTNS